MDDERTAPPSGLPRPIAHREAGPIGPERLPVDDRSMRLAELLLAGLALLAAGLLALVHSPPHP